MVLGETVVARLGGDDVGDEEVVVRSVDDEGGVDDDEKWIGEDEGGLVEVDVGLGKEEIGEGDEE